MTFILAVDPFLEPSNGPNYFPFDPELTYKIQIDNNHDAIEDLTLTFKFQTEIRAPGVFTGFVGAGAGLVAPENSPPPVAPGTPLIPPAITALDGAGSEGLNLRQSYTMTIQRRGQKRGRVLGLKNKMYAVPSNVGPRTMPDYPALADQGIYEFNGIKVFAAQWRTPSG